MDQASDLPRTIRGEEVDNLKTVADSLMKVQMDGHGPPFAAKQETRFLTQPVKSFRSHPSLMSRQELDDLRKEAEFKLQSWRYFLPSGLIKRFIHYGGLDRDDFGEKRSKHFNSHYGVFTLPATGKYRFGISGYFKGSGTAEWFLCCDGDDERDRRPIYFDETDDYDSYKNERRLPLFKIDGNDWKCVSDGLHERFVVLYAQEGMHVWVECLRDKEVEGQEEQELICCVFSGLYLE